MTSPPLRVLAVSHAAVIPVNQEPFDALARAGADVTVVAPLSLRTDLRGEVRLEHLPGAACTVVGLPIALGGYGTFVGQRGVHLIVYRGLDRVIERARPDVVFVEEEPFSLAGAQCARAARRRRIPFAIHENQNIDRPLPPPFGAIRTAVLRRAAGVTARNHAAGLVARANGFRGPVATLPHAVDPARYDVAARDPDLPRPVVGFVGRLVPEKGILDLIEALRRAGEGSLLVVGDGPARAEAEARARGSAARFLGAIPHDEMPAWYGAMDVVAIPSRTTPTWKEQFGRIVIEANAAGVPVVTSDSGALPETVEATGGGVVVLEANLDALAEALRALLKDADRRHALGEAGRAAVRERFTPDAVGRDLLAFLERVAGR